MYDKILRVLRPEFYDARIAELDEERKSLIDEMHRLAMSAVELERVQGVLVGALETLARLGNGDRYGNSDGNMIAIAALAEVKKPAQQNCLHCEHMQYSTTSGGHCYKSRDKPEGVCAQYKEVQAYAAQQQEGCE